MNYLHLHRKSCLPTSFSNGVGGHSGLVPDLQEHCCDIFCHVLTDRLAVME